MEISLIRHGRSKWVQNDWITSKQFENWVTRYNDHGVYAEETYPVETQKKLETANMVYTSDLYRSRESAKLLISTVDIVSDSLFREVELPTLSGIFSKVRLQPRGWTVLMRCLWVAGFSSGCESFSDAKSRAKLAAEKLVRSAGKSQSVVLVGHGFFNILIAKELLQMGWTGVKRPASKHWQITTYTK
ncbi:phosphoglycerate mutase family protein [Robertmurraya korlensis]|uniref:histidine phosphatase family protein n=1 Tax=Robertmurraya korlensis TaxID=519977 RepID=UPI002041B86A|nr:histidine phosphatase family protein [Robertmurraya korlensis]MCM3600832.1 phosphoglycerate mutase family protein [Robertmurraya korlensis]